MHDSIFQLHDNGGYTLLTDLDKAMQDSFMDKKTKTKKRFNSFNFWKLMDLLALELLRGETL